MTNVTRTNPSKASIGEQTNRAELSVTPEVPMGLHRIGDQMTHGDLSDIDVPFQKYQPGKQKLISMFSFENICTNYVQMIIWFAILSQRIEIGLIL